MNLIRTTFLLISLLIIIAVNGSVNAYVLQGPHILELMIQRLGRVKTLQINQKLIIYTDNAELVPKELGETARYFFPASFRSDINSKTSQRIFLKTNASAITVLDGMVMPKSEIWFDKYQELLLYHSRISLHKKLVLQSVDMSITSFGRFEDQIAYVLGAQYPDLSCSQVWIAKETFLPMRRLFKDPGKSFGKSDGNSYREIRYLDWKMVKKSWYPYRIQFYQDQQLLRELKVVDIRADISFEKNYFSIAHILETYPKAEKIPEHEPEVKDSDVKDINEVKQSIEDFKKRFE